MNTRFYITEELISQTFFEQIHNEYRLLPFNENNKFHYLCLPSIKMLTIRQKLYTKSMNKRLNLMTTSDR